MSLTRSVSGAGCDYCAPSEFSRAPAPTRRQPRCQPIGRSASRCAQRKEDPLPRSRLLWPDGSKATVPPTQFRRRGHVPDRPRTPSPPAEPSRSGSLPRCSRSSCAPLPGASPRLRLPQQPLPPAAHGAERLAASLVHELPELQSRAGSRTRRALAREVLGTEIPGHPRVSRTCGPDRAPPVHPAPRLQGEPGPPARRLAGCQRRSQPAYRHTGRGTLARPHCPLETQPARAISSDSRSRDHGEVRPDPPPLSGSPPGSTFQGIRRRACSRRRARSRHARAGDAVGAPRTRACGSVGSPLFA
jgi:hypothetical protein